MGSVELIKAAYGQPNDDTSILVNNHAVLVVPESFAKGKKITVNNGGQLIIVKDPQ